MIVLNYDAFITLKSALSFSLVMLLYGIPTIVVAGCMIYLRILEIISKKQLFEKITFSTWIMLSFVPVVNFTLLEVIVDYVLFNKKIKKV